MHFELLISLRQEKKNVRLISGVADKGSETEEKSPSGGKLLTRCKIRAKSRCFSITIRRQMHTQLRTL